MVFSDDNELTKIIATIQNDGQTERYECIISACENPVCTCGTLARPKDYITLNPMSVRQKKIAQALEIGETLGQIG